MTTSMIPNALLFDLDGTLTDNYLGIARSICHALDRLGVAPPDAATLRRCVGPPLRESFRWLLDTDDADIVEQAIGHYRERFADVGWRENIVYDGIPEVMATLAATGRPMYLCTSKPEVFARRIVTLFGFTEHLAGIYGADLAGTFDDKVKLLAHLAARERIDPAGGDHDRRPFARHPRRADERRARASACCGATARGRNSPARTRWSPHPPNSSPRCGREPCGGGRAPRATASALSARRDSARARQEPRQCADRKDPHAEQGLVQVRVRRVLAAGHEDRVVRVELEREHRDARVHERARERRQEAQDRQHDPRARPGTRRGRTSARHRRRGPCRTRRMPPSRCRSAR